MASITKRGSKWRASVYRNGQRRTATFTSKTEARLWANQIELELEESKDDCMMSFSEVLERFKTEISSKKRCFYTEKYVIEWVKRAEFAQKPISKITSADIAAWKNAESNRVSNSTLLREMAVVKQTFKIAVNEWNLVTSNPAAKISRPSVSKPRNRRISPQEIQDIAVALGWKPTLTIQNIATAFSKDIAVSYSKDIAVHCRKNTVSIARKRTATQNRFQVAIAFLLAIETGMRKGEMLSMTWKDIDLSKRTVYLPFTKNGDSRYVPLSQTAISLLEQLRNGKEKPFSILKDYVTLELGKVCQILGIKNLHFHDTRHEAVTRLAKKLNVLELARIIGHRNISQLMTYYNEDAEEIARKLD